MTRELQPSTDDHDLRLQCVTRRFKLYQNVSQVGLLLRSPLREI